ncbi:hypothetical protein ABIC11_004327 [Pseudomonas oryzihabitans]
MTYLEEDYEPVDPGIENLESFCAKIEAETPNAVGSTPLKWLDPALIEDEPGFALRNYEEPRVQAHIAKLVKAWHACKQMEPIRVEVKEGRCYLRKGGCRLRAALIAREQGAMIKRVAVIEVRERGARSTVHLLNSDDHLSLTPIERAQGYQRLVDEGLSTLEVATEIGKTAAHVRDAITLLRMPSAVQRMVADRIAKPHLALDVWRRYGEQAEEVLLQAQERARLEWQALVEGGSTTKPTVELGCTPAAEPEIRITNRHVQVPTRRFGKKFVTELTHHIAGLAEQFRANAVPDLQNDRVALHLSTAEYQAFLELSAQASAHLSHPGTQGANEPVVKAADKPVSQPTAH